MSSRLLSILRAGFVTLFFVCLLTGLSGCDYLPFGVVPVAEIMANPSKYEGKEVKVKGIVRDATKLPLLGVKFYGLEDNGNQIMVVPAQTMPAEGSKVTVIGIVESIAIMGKDSAGLHIREVRRIE